MQSVHQITLKALERPAIRDQYAGSMEPVLLIIAIFGFFIGSVAAQQTFRWIALLSVVTSRQAGDFLGPPRRRLLWVVPFVVFFHPGLYIIGALVAITSCYLLNRLSGEWGWFLLGVYINSIVTGLRVASRYRRFRRKSRGA
jgi:hypothetical protein